MTGTRAVLAVAAASIAYVAALYAPPPAGLTLAPLLAGAIAGLLLKGSPGLAAGAGLVAGGLGFALAAASVSGLGGLWLIPGLGTPAAAIVTASYHLLAPAALAYVFEAFAASTRPHTVP